MKMKIVTLLLMLCAGSFIAPEKAASQSVSFQVFYDDLSPHGTWINNPDYGYVWVPNVSAGFTPYRTNGHWVYTDYGWTWVSNYSWGWAPFHYGRWDTDPMYGPIWVPGNEWSPGWVTWRSSGSYYGWAPIGPGVSMSVAYGSGYYAPYSQYTFVKSGYMGSTTINNYYVNTSSNTTIINNTTVISNTRVDQASKVTYNMGPQRAEVEIRSGKTFTPVAVKESSKPGQTLSDGQLKIYRPQVQKSGASGAKPAPAKVASMKEVKPAAQRTSTAQPQKATQPTKQPSAQPQRTTKPANQQPLQPQRSAPPTEQKRLQPERVNQPERQQPSQPQRSEPVRQQQPDRSEPIRQQPSQPQHNEPMRQQPPPQQRELQQQAPQQHNSPPPQQERSQPQQRSEPPRQQQSLPQQAPQQHGNPNQGGGRPH
jgi:hypothetical protein